MKRVLVTGGAGFIGSHTCKALAQAGYEPIVYDDLSAGYSKLVKWGPLAEGDTRDVHRLGDVFRRYRPIAVVHFAARIAVGESVTDPASHYSTNVTGTLTVLEAMRAAGVDQIVFSSSAAVYGIPQTELVAESHALAPINPYGRTKLIVEQALADFSGAYGLRSLALRYFNAAGADPEGDTGELHNPETHLIPLALDAVTRPDRPLTVFGQDYLTPDGTCVRDYVHVSDLAQAHVLALKLLESGEAPLALNVGTGRGYSVREVIGAVERVTNCRVPCRYGDRRSGDPAVLVSDSRTIRQTFGWLPVRSDIDTIVRTAYEWHRKQTDNRSRLIMLDEITPVILTFNEAPNIGRTLARLTWARRVVVVDSGSDDDTEAICKTYANVAFLTHAFVTHAEQWNWALNNTAVTTRWVLALDADYCVGDELLAEVRSLDPAVDGVVGYRVPFKYRQSGRVLRGSLYPSVVALFARESSVYCQDGHTQRLRVDGDVGQLTAFIVHDDRKSLQRWLTSQDRYAELECAHLLSTPMSKLSLQDKVRRSYFLAPFVVPLYCLIVKGLVFDGLPGWIYAFQRGIAETILAVKLIERRIGTSA